MRKSLLTLSVSLLATIGCSSNNPPEENKWKEKWEIETPDAERSISAMDNLWRNVGVSTTRDTHANDIAGCGNT